MFSFNSATKRRLAWLIPVLVWTQVVAGSAWWSISSLSHQAQQMAAQRGRDLFRMIELTRQWNAGHIGIYAVRSRQAQPNPYLTLPNRDLETAQGLELTMINAAYMTRQISELARAEGFYFHMTSDDPLRPANAPDEWERDALASFKHGASERIELLESSSGGQFRYMAPLRVEPECLGCHAVQGEQLGDVRGGISVNIDATSLLAHRDREIAKTAVSHAIVWLAIAMLLYHLIRTTQQRVLRLDLARVSQARTIKKKERDLAVAKNTIQQLQRLDSLTGLYSRSHFEKALQELVDRSEARDETCALMIAELDDFNAFNQAYGMLEGDIVLRSVADVATAIAGRHQALCGRYVGSSIALAVPASNRRQLLAIAEGLRRDVYELGIRHEHSRVTKFVTVTVGCALCEPDPASSAEQLLKQAALAMYEGKQKGHNCVVLR